MADPRPSRRAVWLRAALRLLAVIAVAYGIHLLLGRLVALGGPPAAETLGPMRLAILLGLLLSYALLMAIPFVPGVEIGLALLAMEGAWIAPYVYAATVTGLMLAYILGARVSYRSLDRFFGDLGLDRAAGLVRSVEPLSRQKRLALLRSRLPEAIAPLAVRFRYVLLALVLNVPGNVVLGGGGGIALVAGLSRLFDWRAVILTLALAVAPVPLAIWLFGMEALF